MPDLESKVQTSLSFDVEDRLLVLSAPELPSLIRVISTSGLEDGHLCEFSSGEIKLAETLVELEFFDFSCRPDLLLFVPNTDLDIVLDRNEQVFRDHNLDCDGIRLDLTHGVRVRDVAESILSRINVPDSPLHGLTGSLGILVESEVNHTTDDDVWVVSASLDCHVVIAGPDRTDDELLTAVLSGGLASNTTKLHVFVELGFTGYITVDAELQILGCVDEEELLTNVRLVLSAADCVLELFHLFRRDFSLVLNVLEDVGADGVKLLKDDASHLLHVI